MLWLPASALGTATRGRRRLFSRSFNMNRLSGNSRMANLFQDPDDAERLPTICDPSLDCIELRFTLRNEPSLIQPLAKYLRDQAAALGLCNGTLEKHVGIALEEALLNALYH